MICKFADDSKFLWGKVKHVKKPPIWSGFFVYERFLIALNGYIIFS